MLPINFAHPRTVFFEREYGQRHFMVTKREITTHVRDGSFTTELGYPCHVRFTSGRDRWADLPVRQLRTKSGLFQAPLVLHFGEAATTNSAVSVTFDFIEFEMKHSASTLSMISRARSSSAVPLRVTRGRTATSVMRYVPSTFSSRPSASLSYPTGTRLFAWASVRKVSIMHVLTEPTSSSSGAQTSG
jgi:hypothetical protein